jgi:YhcH/YjgK/YiaL family protein
MIAAALKDLGGYRGLNPNLDTAIAWLEAGGWEALPLGRKDIDGEKVYALVQSYKTKQSEAARYESHRSYLDIQMLISGREIIEVTDREKLKVSEPYKPDIEFYETPEPNPCFSMTIVPGEALVLFPEDAHRPCLAADSAPAPVKKLVLKIAI